MNVKFLVAGIAALATATVASAQDRPWSKEQTAVWAVVTQSWADEVAENGRWPEAYVADGVVAWGQEFPMPRYKSSIVKWTRFNDKQSKPLEYEIAPAAITIDGNTAVVFYTAVEVTQRGTEKPEREVTALTETLIRDGGSWKFLATTGYDLKK